MGPLQVGANALVPRADKAHRVGRWEAALAEQPEAGVEPLSPLQPIFGVGSWAGTPKEISRNSSELSALPQRAKATVVPTHCRAATSCLARLGGGTPY